MTQKDYVSRSNSQYIRHKIPNRKKKRYASSKANAIIAITAALLITFIGSLYFAYDKSDETAIISNHSKRDAVNGLPPKPEERWSYIKELENRQLGVQFFTEKTAGKDVTSSTQLTDEQQQLLEQIQADMRRDLTHCNKMPDNNQK